MKESIEINQGEIKVKFNTPQSGKLSLAELGLKDENLFVKGGFLRLVFDFEGIGEHHYFKMPTLKIAYKEKMADTHWICDFNRTTILDKVDHHGHSTIILLDRDKISKLEHHHENKLTIHAEFPGDVHLLAEESFVNFFL